MPDGMETRNALYGEKKCSFSLVGEDTISCRDNYFLTTEEIVENLLAFKLSEMLPERRSKWRQAVLESAFAHRYRGSLWARTRRRLIRDIWDLYRALCRVL